MKTFGSIIFIVIASLMILGFVIKIFGLGIYIVTNLSDYYIYFLSILLFIIMYGYLMAKYLPEDKLDSWAKNLNKYENYIHILLGVYGLLSMLVAKLSFWLFLKIGITYAIVELLMGLSLVYFLGKKDNNNNNRTN